MHFAVMINRVDMVFIGFLLLFIVQISMASRDHGYEIIFGNMSGDYPTGKQLTEKLIGRYEQLVASGAIQKAFDDSESIDSLIASACSRIVVDRIENVSKKLLDDCIQESQTVQCKSEQDLKKYTTWLDTTLLEISRWICAMQYKHCQNNHRYQKIYEQILQDWNDRQKSLQKNIDQVDWFALMLRTTLISGGVGCAVGLKSMYHQDMSVYKVGGVVGSMLGVAYGLKSYNVAQQKLSDRKNVLVYTQNHAAIVQKFMQDHGPLKYFIEKMYAENEETIKLAIHNYEQQEKLLLWCKSKQ